MAARDVKHPQMLLTRRQAASCTVHGSLVLVASNVVKCMSRLFLIGAFVLDPCRADCTVVYTNSMLAAGDHEAD